eukprot:2144435-Amphidinium_carterae.1
MRIDPPYRPLHSTVLENGGLKLCNTQMQESQATLEVGAGGKCRSESNRAAPIVSAILPSWETGTVIRLLHTATGLATRVLVEREKGHWVDTNSERSQWSARPLSCSVFKPQLPSCTRLKVDCSPCSR